MKVHSLQCRLFFIAFFSFLFIFFTGCYQEKYPDRPTVALVVKTLNNPFFNNMQQGAEQMADSLELNLIVQAAEREVDVEKQVQIVENLIQRRVNAILLTPSGSREVVPVIGRANEAGIPVINLDTRVDMDLLERDGSHISVFIGSDNYEGGRIAGNYVAGQLNGSGKVAILEGIPGHETADSRQSGFLDALAEYPDIVVAASQTANWERDMGYNVFENILQTYSDLDAVFAANDLMALGAVEAMAANGFDFDDIVVVGFDAHSEAIQAIREGRMNATVAQNPYEIGRSGVKHAYQLLNNEEVLQEITIEIKLVTAETIDN